MKKSWIFTFGSGQENENCFVEIFAENQIEARKIMNLKFGNKWSMMYNTREEAGVYRYNLTEIFG